MFNGLKHRGKARAAHALVKLLSERLDIHICRIQQPLHLVDTFLCHKAICDKVVFQAFFFCQLHAVIGKFKKYGRLCIGVGYALTACLQCLVDNLLRSYIFAEDFLLIFWHLGYFKILAVETSEIAAHGCNRVGTASGLELKKWFFFYWVYMLGNYLTVDKGIQRAAFVLPDTTNTPFAVSNLAVMGAEKAVNIVFFRFIIETGFHISICDLRFLNSKIDIRKLKIHYLLSLPHHPRDPVLSHFHFQVTLTCLVHLFTDTLGKLFMGCGYVNNATLIFYLDNSFKWVISHCPLFFIFYEIHKKDILNLIKN